MLNNKEKRTIIGIKLDSKKVHLNTLGDCWENTWADDDLVYTISDDCIGISDELLNLDLDKYTVTNLAINQMTDINSDSPEGTTINHMNEYGKLAALVPDCCSDGCCWKGMGIICVDGVLYVSLGRHDYGHNSGDFNFRQTARDASIIKSLDHGKTWTRSMTENYHSPMFHGGKFGTPYFINFGKDGESSVHGADKYIYAVSNNGFWDNGDYMILGRVLKAKIGNLDSVDWEYYKGEDGNDDANWSKYINEAYKIINSSGECSMCGAQYIEQLNRYIMIQWYYTSGSGQNAVGAETLGLVNAGAETIWDFYESPAPWGPWTKFQSTKMNPEGCYNPCIAIKSISDDGKKLTIFTNGNFHTYAMLNNECIYRLITIDCELIID